MTGDGRVRHIGQAEFHHPAALAVRQFVDADAGKEAVQHQFPHFVPAQFRRAGRTDQAAAAAEQGDGDRLRRGISQQPLLGDPALLDQLRQFGGGEAAALAQHAAFGAMRQGQIDVVAAQHQVIADRDAGQSGFVGAGLNLDQRQVHGAAADIDHQQQTHRFELARQQTSLLPEPVVTDRLRLFQQAQTRQTG